MHILLLINGMVMVTSFKIERFYLVIFLAYARFFCMPNSDYTEVFGFSWFTGELAHRKQRFFSDAIEGKLEMGSVYLYIFSNPMAPWSSNIQTSIKPRCTCLKVIVHPSFGDSFHLYFAASNRQTLGVACNQILQLPYQTSKLSLNMVYRQILYFLVAGFEKKIFWLWCRDHPMQSSIYNKRGSRTRMTVRKRSSLGVRLNIIYIKHSCSSRTESTLTLLVKEWKKNPQIKPTPYPAGVWTLINSCAIGFQMKNTLFAQVFWKVLTKNRKVNN